MKKTIFLVPLIILPFFIFISCTVRSDLFIQNLISKDISLKVAYNIKIDELSELPDYGSNHFEVDYVERILDPKEFYSINKVNIIKKQQLDDNSLSIRIPKNSTVRIEETFNMSYIHYINYIEYNDRKILIDELINLSKRRRRHSYIFTIKPENE